MSFFFFIKFFIKNVLFSLFWFFFFFFFFLCNKRNTTTTTKCSEDDDDVSIESTHTLTNETFNGNKEVCQQNKKNKKKQQSPDQHKRTNNNNSNNDKNKYNKTENNSNEALSQHLSLSSSPSSCCESGEITVPSNNSISLPPTPLDTPVPLRKFSLKKKCGKWTNRTGKKDKTNDNVAAGEGGTLVRNAKCANGNLTKRTKNYLSDDVSRAKEIVDEEQQEQQQQQPKQRYHEEERDNDSLVSSRDSKCDGMKKLSVSNVTLTNVNIFFLLFIFFFFFCICFSLLQLQLTAFYFILKDSLTFGSHCIQNKNKYNYNSF